MRPSDLDNESPPWARALGGHFSRGLAVILPVGATLWVLWWLFVAIDSLLPEERLIGRDFPGLGILIFLGLVLFVGLLTRSHLVRSMLRRAECVLLGIPGVRLIYSTFRDFVNAFFVKKRFDKPVLVKLGGGFDAEVIGFITRQNLEALGILDKVAVYFPQSYNIGGNVLILPQDRLTPISADSALVMSFIVTGGVASADGPAPNAPKSEPLALPSPLERCPQEVAGI